MMTDGGGYVLSVSFGFEPCLMLTLFSFFLFPWRLGISLSFGIWSIVSCILSSFWFTTMGPLLFENYWELEKYSWMNKIHLLIDCSVNIYTDKVLSLKRK